MQQKKVNHCKWLMSVGVTDLVLKWLAISLETESEVIYQTTIFAGSRFSDMRMLGFSLFYIIGSRIFGLLVGENKHFKEVSLRSGKWGLSNVSLFSALTGWTRGFSKSDTVGPSSDTNETTWAQFFLANILFTFWHHGRTSSSCLQCTHGRTDNHHWIILTLKIT